MQQKTVTRDTITPRKTADLPITAARFQPDGSFLVVVQLEPGKWQHLIFTPEEAGGLRHAMRTEGA